MNVRRRIYQIIEVAEEDDLLSKIYDFFMMGVIAISLIPLTIKGLIIRGEPAYAVWIDRIAAGIFIVDYALRLATADMKLKKATSSFVIYPFTPMAIIDL